MKPLPTKISKSGTTKESATVSGQRELVRELRNKINEIIDYLGEDEETVNIVTAEHAITIYEEDGLFYDFVKHCINYPELRFWQALANWSGYNIYATNHDGTVEDTYYWTGRTKEDDGTQSD